MIVQYLFAYGQGRRIWLAMLEPTVAPKGRTPNTRRDKLTRKIEGKSRKKKLPKNPLNFFYISCRGDGEGTKNQHLPPPPPQEKILRTPLPVPDRLI